MSRKRRVFDIDLPDDTTPEVSDALDIPNDNDNDNDDDNDTKSMLFRRRGPMAAAIGETGDALRNRNRVEAEIRVENDALAEEFVRLKAAGLVTDLIPVESIECRKLVRDRITSGGLDLDELKTSLREIGLSNPIRIEATGQGGYELVEGLRRLTAYRELLAETDDPRWATIPAALLETGLTEGALYRRMVDENLVRKDVTFAEMAMLAMAYADARVEGCEDTDMAVGRLYASVSPQKRSYIRRFAVLMRKIGKLLDHPTAIPRALGLALIDRIEAEPASLADLKDLLTGHNTDADGEVAVLRAFLEAHTAPMPLKGRGAPRSSTRRGRVALTVPIGPGVRCTATDGRIELRASWDFAAVDRDQLEAAITAFWTALDDG